MALADARAMPARAQCCAADPQGGGREPGRHRRLVPPLHPARGARCAGRRHARHQRRGASFRRRGEAFRPRSKRGSQAQGFAARAAIASTPEAALALARFGDARVICRRGPRGGSGPAPRRAAARRPAARCDDAAAARGRRACAASATSSCARARRSPRAAAGSFHAGSTPCSGRPDPHLAALRGAGLLAERRFPDGDRPARGRSRRRSCRWRAIFRRCSRGMAKARGGSRSASFASMARVRHLRGRHQPALARPGCDRAAVSRTVRGRQQRRRARSARCRLWLRCRAARGRKRPSGSDEEQARLARRRSSSRMTSPISSTGSARGSASGA